MAATTSQPPRMTKDEIRLIRDMVHEQGMKPSEVATVVKRSLGAVCRQLAKTRPTRMGRPAALSTQQVTKLVDTVELLVTAADAEHEVTLGMVLRRSRLKVSERTASRALHKKGYRFRKLRSKMILTPSDITARYEWAAKYRGKPREWWLRKVQMHLDNHHFKHATTVQARKLMAKRSVRGAYRKREKRLTSAHVKPSPKTRTNLGGKGVLKCGGVGGGKVLVWKTVEQTWSGGRAAEMYTETILPALRRHSPGRSKFTILEDNDPTGNLSKKAVAAKQKGNMEVLRIPKRSPDLNVLDYAVWSRVESLLGKQEKKMGAKRETREDFEKRLNRTASRIPKDDIDNWIGDLHKRCRLLYEAKGGLFEEGGRSKRRRRAS